MQKHILKIVAFAAAGEMGTESWSLPTHSGPLYMCTKQEKYLTLNLLTYFSLTYLAKWNK